MILVYSMIRQGFHAFSLLAWQTELSLKSMQIRLPSKFRTPISFNALVHEIYV